MNTVFSVPSVFEFNCEIGVCKKNRKPKTEPKNDPKNRLTAKEKTIFSVRLTKLEKKSVHQSVSVRWFQKLRLTAVNRKPIFFFKFKNRKYVRIRKVENAARVPDPVIDRRRK